MPEGVIVGGWGYVIGAYGLTVLVLGLYTASLTFRLRKASRDKKIEEPRAMSPRNPVPPDTPVQPAIQQGDSDD